MHYLLFRSTICMIAVSLSASLTACSVINSQGQNNQKSASAALVLFSLPFTPGLSVDYSGREEPRRGRLLTAQPVWNLPQAYAENFVSQFLGYVKKTLADYPTLKPQNDIIYYDITYETIDVNGQIVQASGSVWFPRKAGALPLLAFCHGTQLNTDVFGIRIQPGLFAGRGFVSVGPDFLGYGVSGDIDHPYLHAATLASSTIDSIRAAKKLAEYLGIPLNGKLYVSGVSEGGMAAMATIQELEKNYSAEHPLTAGAPISGPYDLIGTADYYIVPDKSLASGQLNYMVFMTPVYLEIYSIAKPASYYIKEPYATWFSVDRYPRPDSAAVSKEMPTDTSGLMTETFIASYRSGGEAELRNALDLNTTYRFVPKCSLRMYAANEDTHVPPKNADTAQAYFQAHGAHDTSVMKITGDHTDSAVPFMVFMLDWFSAL